MKDFSSDFAKFIKNIVYFSKGSERSLKSLIFSFVIKDYKNA